MSPGSAAGWDGRRGWPSTLAVAGVVTVFLGVLPLLELATTPDRSGPPPAPSSSTTGLP